MPAAERCHVGDQGVAAGDHGARRPVNSKPVIGAARMRPAAVDTQGRYAFKAIALADGFLVGGNLPGARMVDIGTRQIDAGYCLAALAHDVSARL